MTVFIKDSRSGEASQLRRVDVERRVWSNGQPSTTASTTSVSAVASRQEFPAAVVGWTVPANPLVLPTQLKAQMTATRIRARDIIDGIGATGSDHFKRIAGPLG
jgi:hypothetical protein